MIFGYLLILSLSFLIYKVGMIMAPICFGVRVKWAHASPKCLAQWLAQRSAQETSIGSLINILLNNASQELRITVLRKYLLGGRKSCYLLRLPRKIWQRLLVWHIFLHECRRVMLLPYSGQMCPSVQGHPTGVTLLPFSCSHSWSQGEVK